MEYKEVPEHLKGWAERAQAHWDNIDVEALKPIVHGPLPTEEEMAARAAMLHRAEENMRLFMEQQKKEQSSAPAE